MAISITLVSCWRGLKRLGRAILAFILLASAGQLAQAQAVQDYVGLWWKPTESGWGLSIQQNGTQTFAVWYTYDAQGAPVWYTLQCAFTGNTCAGNLATATGTPISQITGSANSTASLAGTGSLTVTSTNRLSLSYTVGSVTQTKTNLEPQNFVSADQVPFCSLQSPTGANFRAGLTNYTDQWWGGPNASGWGVQISHQGNTVFATWYSYNQQRTPTWLTMQGTQDANNPLRFAGS